MCLPLPPRAPLPSSSDASGLNWGPVLRHCDKIRALVPKTSQLCKQLFICGKEVVLVLCILDHAGACGGLLAQDNVCNKQAGRQAGKQGQC